MDALPDVDERAEAAEETCEDESETCEEEVLVDEVGPEIDGEEAPESTVDPEEVERGMEDEEETDAGRTSKGTAARGNEAGGKKERAMMRGEYVPGATGSTGRVLPTREATPAKEAHEGDETRDAEPHATEGEEGEHTSPGCGENAKGAIGCNT